MNNKLIDLNNHLFAQLERLSDEDLKGDKLVQEIERSQAVTGVADKIISNADLVYKAAKLKADGLVREPLPDLLSWGRD